MSKHMSEEIRVPIEADNPSIARIEELCIKCRQCANVCRDYIGVHGTYHLIDTNDTAVCINCGQCANVCPTDCIIEKYEYEDVKRAIADPEKVVIVSTSPSVRVSIGEEFGYSAGTFLQNELVGLLRKLGVDYVLDTNFAADMTIMEEATEFVNRIKEDKPMPQFTSCCPAWVKYAEIYHPELIPNISTTKSPIGMQGPTVKTYFADKMGIDPRKIVHVCVTPCTAKKMEIRRDEMNASARMLGIKGMRDSDYVITTRELAKWTKEENIDFKTITPSSCDKFMGEASGGGVIFANSGGVMESALRTAYELITGEKPPLSLLNFAEVRGYEEVKEATIDIGGKAITVAVIFGTRSADKYIKDMQKSGKKVDFIEVMACPGGCIGGGGQPKNFAKNAVETRKARIASIYNKDANMTIKSCLDNPEIIALYNEFYGSPCSEKAEDVLHTTYTPKPTNLLPEDKWW